MRRTWMVTAAVVVAALATPVRGDELFQWTDKQGVRHFSNAPTQNAEHKQVNLEEGRITTRGAGGDGNDTSGALSPEQAAFSTSASLRREALERDLRDTQHQLRALDNRLAGLTRARMRNAQGTEATGGVAAPAADVRSEEETALAAQREELAKHEAEVRADYAKLREEVSAKLGSTPPWWIDVR